MGRPVFRMHSRTSALDFVRDKVRNHSGGYLKMKILALELSTARGSLAWLDADVELAREWANDRKNSAAPFENLDHVTKQFGAPEVIVVGLGPGSYAGTRIAISAAIGLQVSSRARLIGFPSICAMESDGREYCAIGLPRGNSFFSAEFRAPKLLEAPFFFLKMHFQTNTTTFELPFFV